MTNTRKLAGAGAGIIALIVTGAGVRVLTFPSKAEPPAAASLTDPKQPQRVSVASPGRVEGRTETTGVGASIDGVVRRILVKEGQSVDKGALLAELDCADLRSALQVAEAQVASLEQIRMRLLHGKRQEERDAAAQKTAAARAILDQAATQKDRMFKLQQSDTVSRSTYDSALRDHQVAEALLKQALHEEELANADPLPEEIARADADLLAATKNVQFSKDRIAKCSVRAPFSGSILRIHLREGETFSLLASRPLFSLADLSDRRVRAEVDERDVTAVRVGQSVTVSTDATSKLFHGTVAEISPVMGRKSIQTGDPADKTDRDILEVVASLSADALELPIGLRVTVRFGE